MCWAATPQDRQHQEGHVAQDDHDFDENQVGRGYRGLERVGDDEEQVLGTQHCRVGLVRVAAAVGVQGQVVRLPCGVG